MTWEDVRIFNETASGLTILLNEKETGKKVCMFRNTPMCDGIKVCSACSMRIEEGEQK